MMKKSKKIIIQQWEMVQSADIIFCVASSESMSRRRFFLTGNLFFVFLCQPGGQELPGGLSGFKPTTLPSPASCHDNDNDLFHYFFQ